MIHRADVMEVIRTVFYAVLIAFILRTIVFQPFNIPSESMLPNLMVGDYLLVSKYAYGYSKYSLPGEMDFFEGRVFGKQVKRGDVTVFKNPSDNKTDYIKRIIGLPGDHIQMIAGVLHVNGKAVKRRQVEDYLYQTKKGGTLRLPQFEETLPNGKSYLTLDLDPLSSADMTPEFVVPEGHYFCLGDNRDNSRDSRYDAGFLPNGEISGVGFLPAENLVGRAEFLFYSTDGSARLWQVWKWGSAARTERLFTAIR